MIRVSCNESKKNDEASDGNEISTMDGMNFKI